jgi:hypothetical protein
MMSADVQCCCARVAVMIGVAVRLTLYCVAVMNVCVAVMND